MKKIKMKLISLVVLLSMCSGGKSTAETPKNTKKEINLSIIKNISKNDLDFFFILKNKRHKSIFINNFNMNGNGLTMHFMTKHKYPFIFYVDPANFMKLENNKKLMWSYNLKNGMFYSFKWYSNFASLQWGVGEYKSKFRSTIHTYIWKVDGKKAITYNFASKFDKKDALNFKIAKLIGVKNPYAFAFIASNNTSKKAEIPDFYSEKSRLKVKFPNGDEFVYKPKKEFKNIELAVGKSKFVKFDILKLLKESNEFSKEDFNYGISELIWEIKLDKNKVQKYTFKLLKTEKPLPKAAKTGKGYQLPIDEVIE
ncbi:hypothetical protein AAEX28_02100 [Lentisphaerota bacterium WC36G]|nr:hypothetical protein LJT99_04985 [Lentisphaerae bacterium WC36]